MNNIVKERFLSAILNANGRTKKVFTTTLLRFSYLLMLLLLGGDFEICPGPQTRYQTFARAGFKIVHQNARDILSNNYLLEQFVNKTESKIDVICVFETHIKEGDICENSSQYSLRGYVFLQQNRNFGTCGGVGIFLKHEIKFKRRCDLENQLKSLWIETCLKNSKSVLIGCYCQPPEGSKYLINNFSEVFEEQLTNVVKTNKEIIILGDFNIDYNKTDNRNFKSLLNISGLKQVITEPTRTTNTSSNLIDLIITNRPENITNKDVFANSIADGDTNACSRKVNNICNPKIIKCRNYTNYSPEELKSDVAKFDWSPLYDAANVDLAMHYFISSLQLVFETHAPHIEKRVKRRPCLWLDIDTKKIMSRHDLTMRKARKSKSNDDQKSYKKQM